MSIASEITRLQTSKADIKAQVNIDVDDINEGTDFINDETLDDYADLIENMQDAYKQYIPIHTKMIAKGNTTQDGTPTPSSPVPVNNVTGEQVVTICGKNILPQDKYINNTTINGITFTNNRDGTFSASGTATANTSINIIPFGEIELEANQPYYLYSSIPYNANTFNLSIVMTENNTTKYLTANNTYTPTTTPTQERLTLWIPNGVSVNIQNAKIMLVKGSTRPTEYEKYQGKDYEINLGKNLLDENTLRQGSGYDSTITNRVFFPSNHYLEPDTYTLYTNLDTTNYKYAIGIGTKAYPNPVSYVYDSGWQTLDHVTFTLSKGGYLGVGVAKSDGTSSITPSDISNYHFMLCKGSYDSITSYSPYFTPIELNKIGNYQDFIKKGTGKNLLDQSKLRQGAYHGRDDVQNRLFIDANYYLSPGTYTFFSNFDTSRYRVGVQASTNTYPNELGGNIYDSGWKTIQKIEFTISNYGYLGISISTSNGNDNLTPSDMSGYWFMVCKGSYTDMISYEPYGYKDKWYIEKNVDKFILDKANTSSGKNFCNVNTTWDEQNEGYIHFQFPQIIVKYNDGDKIMIADNRFPSVTIANRNLKAEQIFTHYTNGVVSITIETSRLNGITSSSSVTEKRNAFNTWLTNNPITMYYVMVNPTYTLIENEELLNQLEAVQLQTGENNVLVSGDLPMILDLSKYIQIVENHL